MSCFLIKKILKFLYIKKQQPKNEKINQANSKSEWNFFEKNRDYYLIWKECIQQGGNSLIIWKKKKISTLLLLFSSIHLPFKLHIHRVYLRDNCQ